MRSYSEVLGGAVQHMNGEHKSTHSIVRMSKVCAEGVFRAELGTRKEGDAGSGVWKEHWTRSRRRIWSGSCPHRQLAKEYPPWKHRVLPFHLTLLRGCVPSMLTYRFTGF